MSDQRYLVTARKYRPQRFEEIVAQGHVSETLKNAITLDRLAHAYLFSGPRGVGKTTAARILAKAINCTAALEERDGGEPCRKCDSCKTFEEGRSLNIIEIDAASNNRVEDIRDLRDTVLIPPQGSRKKVYIIDEVHMLSNAAFNALLKTLEEPPSYALFIFATTEPNKVLPTILSRCQRFDFRRIAVPEIVQHLEAICKSENIQADEASLMLIAQKGDGALRDSLSAFDQAVSLCGTSLAYPELAKAFGVVDVELFFEVTQHVVAGNSGGLLQLIDRIIRQGYDLHEFLVGLASHLRNLLVVCTTKDIALIEAAEAVKQQYAQESAQHTEADLLRLLMVVADGEEKLKTSAQPRLQLELTLLKMAAMAHAVDLKTALARLEKLETDVASGSIAANTTGTVAGNVSTSPAVQDNTTQKSVARVVVSDVTTPTTQSKPADTQPNVSPAQSTPPKAEMTLPAAPVPAAPEPAAPASEAQVPPVVVAVAPEPASPPPTAPHSEATVNEPAEAFEPPSAGNAVDEAAAFLSKLDAPGLSDTPLNETETPQTSYQGLFGAPALRKVQQPQQSGDSNSGEAQANLAGAPVSTPGGVMLAEAPDGNLQEVTQAWSAFLKHVKMERIHVSALLQHANPVQLHEETLVLSVPDDFHKRMLSNQQEFLLDHMCNFVMAPVERLSFVIDISGTEVKPDQETASEIDPYEYMQKKRDESPIIRAIFDEFGGEMVW